MGCWRISQLLILRDKVESYLYVGGQRRGMDTDSYRLNAHCYFPLKSTKKGGYFSSLKAYVGQSCGLYGPE